MQNYVLSMINGIADALKEVNPDAKIYTDAPDNVEKDGKGGFFFIQGPIAVTESRFLKDKHQLRLDFDVQFFPENPSSANTAELATAVYAMREALHIIYPAYTENGQYIKIKYGKTNFSKEASIVDGVAHVDASYDLWLDTEAKRKLVQSVFITHKKED